jgi:hypothetical protein
LEKKIPQIAKAILSKNRNTGDTTMLDFKLYYRAIAIKKAWYWHQNRYGYHWNKIRVP